MNAIDRLNEIEARANAATGGPWGVYDGAESILTEHDCTGDCEDFHPILVRNQVDGVPLPSVWSTPEDAVFIAQARTDVPALVAALRAVLEEIDKRGKQAREALPPSLAALAVPSYQFNVRASDVIRAIEEALS